GGVLGEPPGGGGRGVGGKAFQRAPGGGVGRGGGGARPPQPPLGAAEGAPRLPPLAVHPPVPTPAGLLAEPADHLPAVAGPGPLAAPAPVEGDDRRPDAQLLAAGGGGGPRGGAPARQAGVQ